MDEYTNAVSIPETSAGIDASAIVEEIADCGVLVRDGLGRLAEIPVRIGTMGTTGREDVLRTLKALRTTLESHSVKIAGDGTTTAEAVFD